MMQLSQVSQAVDGQMIGKDVALLGLTTDTRFQCNDQLFVALKGENFDAHDFVAQAEHAGASALLVEHEVDSELPKVIVVDCHQALKDIASWWRAQFVIPVIGVTGSVGKTSVKEMLGCIFSEIGQGVVTQGNLNNEIGMPLTLMKLDKDDRYAIVEMGMNHAGEIDRLTRIAKPTIAVINNAAAAHLEGLGTVEAVAKAKGEIFAGLSDDGVAVINADDTYANLWRELIGERHSWSFGFSESADVRAEYETKQYGLKIKVKAPEQEFKVKLATFGKHNVSNALAAIAVALCANIPAKLIAAGLEKYRPINGRLTITKIDGITIIDDTYNANPASMQAAIEVLSDYQNSVLIVGDMAELGEGVDAAHRDIGRQAAKYKIDSLYACGEFSQSVVSEFNGSSEAFETQEDLINALDDRLSKLNSVRPTILVKGSRGAKMENVVAHLQDLIGAAEQNKVIGGSQAC